MEIALNVSFYIENFTDWEKGISCVLYGAINALTLRQACSGEYLWLKSETWEKMASHYYYYYYYYLPTHGFLPLRSYPLTSQFVFHFRLESWHQADSGGQNRRAYYSHVHTPCPRQTEPTHSDEIRWICTCVMSLKERFDFNLLPLCPPAVRPSLSSLWQRAGKVYLVAPPLPFIIPWSIRVSDTPESTEVCSSLVRRKGSCLTPMNEELQRKCTLLPPGRFFLPYCSSRVLLSSL